MSFIKNHYQVIKNIIPKDVVNFVNNYFSLKRKVFDTFLDYTYVSKFNIDWGSYGDLQVPNTYSHYADIAMETLLTQVQPIMEKESGVKLNPTYSYARIYKKGDILKRHKDRFSCEISTTLNLGGDKWPIYIDPDSKNGHYDEKTKKYVPGKSAGIKIDLEPGDMLMYRGCILEHWRDIFLGNSCTQVFLHYNDAENKINYEQTSTDKNIYDTRPHLGLPQWFRNKNDKNKHL